MNYSGHARHIKEARKACSLGYKLDSQEAVELAEHLDIVLHCYDEIDQYLGSVEEDSNLLSEQLVRAIRHFPHVLWVKTVVGTDGMNKWCDDNDVEVLDVYYWIDRKAVVFADEHSFVLAKLRYSEWLTEAP